MKVRLGINGFSRIGRAVFRRLIESGEEMIEIVGINDLAPLETMAYLLKYDSTLSYLKNMWE